VGIQVGELAPEVAEASQFDLAGPVVDDRLLVERELAQHRLGIGQALAVVGVRGDHREQAEQTGKDQGREEKQGDRDENALGSASSAGAPRR
jgi:hypothetical protein